MVVKPHVVERSNDLNWTFARIKPYHKLVIHQTLNELLLAKSDIVQAGDSTGFHGIRPMLDARARQLLNYADPRELTLRVK